MSLRYFLVVALTLALSPYARAGAPTLDDFIRRPLLGQFELSPDGKHLAAVVPISQDQTDLGIVPIENPSGLFRVTIGSGQREHVASFEWVNEHQLVVSLGKSFGPLAQPQATGELMLVDVQQRRARLLHSWRAERGGTTTAQGKRVSGFARLVQELPEDRETILISLLPFGGAHPELHRMRLSNGSSKRLAVAPLARAELLSDPLGRHLVAYGSDVQGVNKVYYRRLADESWTLIHDEAGSGTEMRPWWIAPDGRIYAEFSHAQGPNSFERFDPADGQRERLYRGRLADPAVLLRDGRGEPYALLAAEGEWSWHELAPDAPAARFTRALAKQFPGEFAYFISLTADGKKALFEVSSLRNPGDLYLFDFETKNAEFIASRRAWLDPEQMAATKVVEITARDGLTLPGYLTLPPNRESKGLPLIVLPHGGPHGIRDWPNFDVESQILAQHGYAVLKVNFRGSGGYGKAFQEAGYRQWGATMQDDLTDATRWTIDQGYADPKRICIYGASYGGYAALMGLVREPELYACGVSYVGVSDLALMYTRGDIEDTVYGENYLKRVLGEDREELATRSPAQLADRIRAPVFLIHGSLDERVPMAHFEAIKKALERRGQTPETLVKRGEGHGFWKDANQRELYQRLLDFFDRHIGPKAPLAAR